MPEVQCFLLLHTPVTHNANRCACCSLWCDLTEPNSSRDWHRKTPLSKRFAQQQHPPAQRCSPCHPLPGLLALPFPGTVKVPVTVKTRSPKLSIPGHRPSIPDVSPASFSLAWSRAGFLNLPLLLESSPLCGPPASAPGSGDGPKLTSP